MCGTNFKFPQIAAITVAPGRLGAGFCWTSSRVTARAALFPTTPQPPAGCCLCAYALIVPHVAAEYLALSYRVVGSLQRGIVYRPLSVSPPRLLCTTAYPTSRYNIAHRGKDAPVAAHSGLFHLRYNSRCQGPSCRWTYCSCGCACFAPRYRIRAYIHHGYPPLHAATVTVIDFALLRASPARVDRNAPHCLPRAGCLLRTCRAAPPPRTRYAPHAPRCPPPRAHAAAHAPRAAHYAPLPSALCHHHAPTRCTLLPAACDMARLPRHLPTLHLPHTTPATTPPTARTAHTHTHCTRTHTSHSRTLHYPTPTTPHPTL